VAAAIISTGIAQTAHAAELSVDVAGLKNAKGKVMVAVYNRAEDFLKKSVQTGAVDARQGKVTVVIGNLPAGDYALSVFQDENSNGQLDTNPIGMPTEPYGFGNDAAGHFGPPSFEQTLVHLAETGSQVTVNLR
jgi:uncharacterized protein (DUF2141 family)